MYRRPLIGNSLRVAVSTVLDITSLLVSMSFPKLLRSYALDAIDRSMDLPFHVGDHNQQTQSLSDFLNTVASAHYESFKAVGEGKDLRFSDNHVCVAALHEASSPLLKLNEHSDSTSIQIIVGGIGINGFRAHCP